MAKGQGSAIRVRGQESRIKCHCLSYKATVVSASFRPSVFNCQKYFSHHRRPIVIPIVMSIMYRRKSEYLSIPEK